MRTVPVEDEPQAAANTPWVVHHSPSPDCDREARYIENRRELAGVNVDQPVTALCFSGGGLRSATVNLGVLQGLEETGILKQADYISGASGGMYTASWFVSHLLPAGSESVMAADGYNSYHADRSKLLQIKSEGLRTKGAVDSLVDGRGFFLGVANWRIAELIPSYLARLPVNTVFDVGLHVTPTRGKFNWHHMSYVYDKSISRTYLAPPALLQKWQESDFEGFFKNRAHEVTLAEVNPEGSVAPYLVIGATLTNTIPHVRSKKLGLLPFEFSRYSVGAPILGYVPAEDFGFPVIGELPPENGCRRTVQRANPVQCLPCFTTKPIKLSTAVAASGAAVDSAGISNGSKLGVRSMVRDSATGRQVPIVSSDRLKLESAFKLLNLNLRYRNRNFAMAPSVERNYPWSFWDECKDRFTEVTADRFRPTLNSNGLYISDGGHYDNLGVLAMLERPNVEEIWAFDAENDIDYNFSGLNRLSELINWAGWAPLNLNGGWDHGRLTVRGGFGLLKEAADGEAPKRCREWRQDQGPVFHTVLTKGKRKVSFWYVKNSYRRSDGKLLKPLCNEREFVGKKSVSSFLEAYRHGEFTYRGNITPDKFPHTSTGNVSFTKSDFAAYREMGRVLGHALAAELNKGQ